MRARMVFMAVVRDSRLTTRLLLKSAQVTAASPAYLKTHGVPKTPADLTNHNCIIGRFGPDWGFRKSDGRRFVVRVEGSTVINNGDGCRRLGNHTRDLVVPAQGSGARKPFVNSLRLRA